METTAVRLIRAASDGLHFLTCNHCRVDYRPSKKYRVEKPNAFDPSFIHRRAPWHEDEIEVVLILQPPDGYSSLLGHLKAAGSHYIEFTWRGSSVMQLPVVCTQLPELNDDLREVTAETSATFISRYVNFPTPIDWDGYTIPDGTEEIFP